MKKKAQKGEKKTYFQATWLWKKNELELGVYEFFVFGLFCFFCLFLGSCGVNKGHMKTV